MSSYPEFGTHPFFDIIRLFRTYFNYTFFLDYGFKHFVKYQILNQDDLPIIEAIMQSLLRQGVLKVSSYQNDFFILHPLLFDTTGGASLGTDQKKVELAWINYYDNYANGIDIQITKTGAEQQQKGAEWIGYELDNLLQTHALGLKHQMTIQSFYALCNYNKYQNQTNRNYHLAIGTLEKLEKFDLAKQEGLSFQFMKATALRWVGQHLLDKSQYRRARETFEKIIPIFKKLNNRYRYQEKYGDWIYDGQSRVGSIFLDIGHTWLREHQLQEAIDTYLKAVNVFESCSDNNRIAGALNMLSNCSKLNITKGSISKS